MSALVGFRFLLFDLFSCGLAPSEANPKGVPHFRLRTAERHEMAVLPGMPLLVGSKGGNESWDCWVEQAIFRSETEDRAHQMGHCG